MSESLYCPGQIVPSKEYKENYDKIEWGKPHEQDNLFVYELTKKWPIIKEIK